MYPKRHEIEEHELQGLKYFKAISGLLEKLHGVGCERDRAGNRRLHMDQYVALLLLYLFNPICTSLRSLQQASELKKVQKKLGVPRASLGSLSEAATVFDSRQMIAVITELGQQLEPLNVPDKLRDLPGILTAVDGTLLKALPKIAWALWLDEQHRAVKNHVHFEILKGVPVAATLTEGNGNEKDVLAAHLEAGRIYVLDRGYAKYQLLQAILDHGSSFVNRIRDDYVGAVLEERPISAAGQAAGIVRDRLLRLGSDPCRQALAAPVRVIEVRCTPHPKRVHTGRGGPEQSETLAIATDLVGLEADVIALIFQYRWTIEIFFRFYKHILGCRHLLSHNRNGIELQTYAAIIACMLISLWTGRKPTLRTFEMLCWYFTGMASEEELLTHIQRLQKIG
ncbi:MAG TPA: IS4 family transposase [Verrucomicrobiota bacterium]|nr:IS4 family transposase [Verrucomicrobiota bacterium]